MKQYFIVMKLQEGEKVNAYSVVDEETLKTIPEDLIQAKKEVEDKLYSKEELEALRDSLV